MTRPIRTIALSAPVAVALVLGLAGSALAGFNAPTPVITEPHNQDLASANDTYIVFSSDARRAGHYDVIARPLAGGDDIRLDAKGVDGWAGNIRLGTNVEVFQQVDGGESDLYTYDIGGTGRHALGNLNTKWWEWSPRISVGGNILFTRLQRRHGRWYDVIMLWNETAGRLKKLASYRRTSRSWAATTSVTDTDATWSRATDNGKSSKVFVYDIDSATTASIPTVNDRPQYTGAFDAINDNIYFVRSRRSCGANVDIYRVPVSDLSATPLKIADLPAGIDMGSEMFLAPGAPLEQDLLFTEWDCDANAGDIWSIANVDDTTP